MEDRNHESRLRRKAGPQGLALRKSRAGLSIDNHGDYRLVDLNRNWIVAGERFDLSLGGVEAITWPLDGE